MKWMVLLLVLVGCDQEGPCFTRVVALGHESSFTNDVYCHSRSRMEQQVISGRVVVTCRCPQDARDQ